MEAPPGICVNILRQHPASTAGVNTLRQHPASTPCCSQGPLQRKSSISFVPGAHYKGNLQFPLFPEPATKEICNFLCSQGTILRQHPASTAGVHRCPRLTPVPKRRPTGLQAIWKVARNCPGKGGASGSIIGCVLRPFGVTNPSSIKNCPFAWRQQQMISKK